MPHAILGLRERLYFALGGSPMVWRQNGFVFAELTSRHQPCDIVLDVPSTWSVGTSWKQHERRGRLSPCRTLGPFIISENVTVRRTRLHIAAARWGVTRIIHFAILFEYSPVHGDAIGRHRTYSTLVQVMSCRLLGSKPLPKTTADCQLVPVEYILMQFCLKFTFSFTEIRFKMSSSTCRPFCSGLIVLYVVDKRIVRLYHWQRQPVGPFTNMV